MKDFEIFKLEDRVLFEAAAAAEIVEAAAAANPSTPNANVSATDKQAQEDREALKNAPPENPSAAQNQDDAPADPGEAADVDARIEQLVEGEIPIVDGDDIDIVTDVIAAEDADADFIEGEIVDNGRTVSTDKELVVINSSVADKDAITAELKPNQDVLILEAKNGLAELNEYLDSSDTKYSAIHFVTHGNDGYISVNGAIIDAENFDAAPWQEIGEHLTDDGDILLYGCDTAANAEGKAFGRADCGGQRRRCGGEY